MGDKMSDETMGSGTVEDSGAAGLSDLIFDKAEQRTLLIAAGVMTGALMASIAGIVLIIFQSAL